MKRQYNLIKINFLFISLMILFNTSYAENHNLTKTGDILQVAIPISASAITLFKDDKEGMGEFLVSFAVANGITHILKLTTCKSPLGRRPNGKSRSFPSGHTASAFQGAFFLQHRYGSAWGMPAIGLAGLTAYSRIKGKYHHTRDVVAGAAISYLTSYFAVTKFNSKNRKLEARYSKEEMALELKIEF